MQHTATYSPDDNKLRLYPAGRLSADEYARVKAAGFKWAPKQGLFVAPMWTPDREDLLAEMCGEIEDEDKSLVERAEERADRFEQYSDNRAADAESARQAVAAIADHIPMGQPILVGHHSEKHARRDAERIENGMRKAVRMWETSKYWTQRAAGAIAHAKYKERPDVRARRIKTLEAEARKIGRQKTEAEMWLKLWTVNGLTLDQARAIADRCWLRVLPYSEEFPGGLTAYDVLRPDGERPARYPGWTVAQVQEVARRSYPATIARCERWAAHYNNRLAYERAMLDEQGASDLLKPKPKRKLLPLCNYRAPGGLKIENMYRRGELIYYPQIEMTQAEYARIHSDYKGTRVVNGTHRIRTALRQHTLVCVFLTDYKETPPPVGEAPKVEPEVRPIPAPRPAPALKPEAAPFEAMREQLRAGGVQVVTAPQLFPTPAELAERMVELAEIEPGQDVLEPSGGTGRIIIAIRKAQPEANITAIEIKPHLADVLRAAYRVPTHCKDFLRCNGELGSFDRILMNPPFANAQDIEHIEHALHMLKPGGRLVAICANGPRQNEKLRPLVEECGGEWLPLPPNTFKDSGTNVNAVLLTLTR